MSTDWIKYKRYGWPTGSKERALGSQSLVSAFLKAKENLKQDPSAAQARQEKESTQCKQIEQVKKEWVLFVNPLRKTFYVEEVEVENECRDI